MSWRRCLGQAARLAASFGLIAAAALAGRLVVAVTGWPVPSSLFGLALLFLLLATGILKLSWVESGAGILLASMALFFVPPAVGLVDHLDVLAREWPAVVAGAAVTTLVLVVGVGRLVERVG